MNLFQVPLLAEYMEESLILIRQTICWKTVRESWKRLLCFESNTVDTRLTSGHLCSCLVVLPCYVFIRSMTFLLRMSSYGTLRNFLVSFVTQAQVFERYSCEYKRFFGSSVERGALHFDQACPRQLQAIESLIPIDMALYDDIEKTFWLKLAQRYAFNSVSYLRPLAFFSCVKSNFCCCS